MAISGMLNLQEEKKRMDTAHQTWVNHQPFTENIGFGWGKNGVHIYGK